MKTYSKGVRAERELLHFLNYKGFSCVRQASSGGHITPVDILAIKRGLVIAIESKAHAKKPRLDRKKLERFQEWCDQAGAIGFLAWRNLGVWLFLRLSDAEQGNYEDGKWIAMDNFLSAFGIE